MIAKKSNQTEDVQIRSYVRQGQIQRPQKAVNRKITYKKLGKYLSDIYRKY